MNLLAISGSLRGGSSNFALLKAAQLLAPAYIRFGFYDGLAGLPHFNPDLDTEVPPPAVAEWRACVAAADALVISAPEYARGVPGSLKNALDWLVSGPEFPGKPVALFHASDRGVHGQAALRLTLETMAARIVEEAVVTVPLLGTARTAQDIAADPAAAAGLRAGLAALSRAVRSRTETFPHRA